MRAKFRLENLNDSNHLGEGGRILSKEIFTKVMSTAALA
jgi:hypothetical protein